MLRYDAVGALGNTFIKTPHLDSLVESGVAFTRAYCQNPVCTPSRASFLTGRYPSATGVVGNGNESFSQHVRRHRGQFDIRIFQRLLNAIGHTRLLRHQLSALTRQITQFSYLPWGDKTTSQ